MTCDESGMSVSSISDLARQHMLSILGYSSSGTGTDTSSTSNLSIGGTNSNQLSPFAQMLAELQKMEQSNPSEYAQVSQQISTNLAAASSTAQAHGVSSMASQLSTLSKDFATAAKTGQLPNVGDIERAMHAAVGSASSAASTAPSSGSSSVGSGLLGKVLSLAGF